jgi:hypothetical protein
VQVRFAVVAALAALVGAGCAGPGPLRASHVLRTRAFPTGARADFDPARFEVVFATAVELVRRRGHEIVTCEAPFGLMTTAPLERDAGCGATTCLAREIARVKLGHRRARVTLTREVWDTAVRAWTRQEDAAVREELSRAEREIVDRMVVGDDAALRRTADDPCVAAQESLGVVAATRPQEK